LRSPRLRQIAGNAGWLIGERLIRGIVGLVVSIVVARGLGVADFGTLAYATSFVLLFNTLWQLGLSGVVVRELVHRPEERNEILGTVFGLRLAGALVGLVAMLLISVLITPPDPAIRWSIVILGVGTVFYAFEGVDFWLQSEVQSRYAVGARLLALVVSSIATLVAIVAGASVVVVAAAASLEYVATGVGYLLAYRMRGHSIRAWRFRLSESRFLVAISWPLVISGLFYSINLRVDQLLLGNIAGDEAVGTYAAAARLSEVWYFVALAIAASGAPALLRARQTNSERYKRRMQQAYDLMVGLSLPLAIVVSLTADQIIMFLYGSQYAGAGAILSIHIWAGPFVFMGAILSKWLIAEDLIKFSMVRHGAGALINIVLNVILIPPLGGVGAALATLISYATASFGACFLYRPAWPAARQMVLALLSPIRVLVHIVRGDAPPFG
jgi:O-antigen/teichoic acid export membrane protein